MILAIVAFVILWLAAPIPLTVLMIVNITEKNKYKRMYEELRMQGNTGFDNTKLSDGNVLKGAENISPTNAADTARTVQTADSVIIPFDGTAQTHTAEPAVPVPDIQPAAPREAEAPEPVPEPAAASAPQKSDKGGVSSMNIMLILGAVFIIISGLIFATTTWKFLSSGIRAAVILSFSAVFFAASFLAEKKLRLEKTGLLFYTLGSVFLPTTLIAAGYFKLFGEWFSLGGDGKLLFYALTFALLSAVCIRGSCKYKYAAFSWTGLISFSAAVCLTVIHLPCDTAVRTLILSVYSLAFIFAAEFFSKKEWDRLSPIMSQIRTFAAVNTLCLGIGSVAAVGMGGNGPLTLLCCIIFSIGFLKNSFAEKNGFAGALPFALFITFGLFAAAAPEGLTGYVFSAAAASAVLVVLSLMNILPDKLRTAFKYVSGAFSVLFLLMFGIASVMSEDITVFTALAYTVFTAEILILSILRREENIGKIMLYVLPFACIGTAGMFSGALFPNDDNASYSLAGLLMLAVIAVLQTVFVFEKKAGLRTFCSDCVFAAAAVFTSFVRTTEMGSFSDSPYTELIAAGMIVFAAVPLILPAIFADKEGKRTLFVCLAFLWAGTEGAAFAAAAGGSDAVEAAAAMITSALLVCVSLAITFRCAQRSVDTGAAASAYAVTLVYAFARLSGSGAVSPFLLFLTVMSAVRYLKLRKRYDLTAMIIMLVIMAGAASADIFDGLMPESRLLFMCGTAALLYVAALFSEKDGEFARLGERLSRYILGTLDLICLGHLAFGSESPIFIAMTALFFLMTVTAFYNSGSTIAAVFPLSAMYFAVSHQLSLLTDGYISYAVIIIMIASIGLSYLLHRDSIAEKRNGAVYLDAFAVSRFFGLISYTALCSDGKERWFVIFLAAGCLLSMCRKGQLPNVRRRIYAVSAFLPVIAWLTQPFFKVPDIIALETDILPFLLYCLSLRFLFRDRTEMIDGITFAVYVLAYLVLFVGAVSGGEVADGLIIVISALAMLVFSFVVKQKKWFLLSVVVLVVSTLFMSRSFWTSLAWWAYLLIAGLVLIAIGAANEMKKQAASRNERTGLEEKITRFMSEWKW